jgi:L-iditol 2-dehydrogenase
MMISNLFLESVLSNAVRTLMQASILASLFPMQAAALTAPGTMSLVERPETERPSADKVLLKVEAVGVCGSDIHYYREGRIGGQVVEYPFVVGHEFSGIVQEVGASVTRVKNGDRVAVDPAVSCGTCDQCRGGRAHTCRNLRFLGCPGQMEGCLVERIVMPARCCFPVSPALGAAVTALIEPLSIAIHASRLAGNLQGARVSVHGAGPIGLCVVLACRAAGAGEIRVVEPIPERRKAALRLGATSADAPGSATPEVAVTFECAGEQAAFDEALSALGPGGRMIMVGIPSMPRWGFDADLGRRREIALLNVRRQNECMEPAICLAEAHRENLDSLVTHRFPLARCGDAFELVAHRREGVLKALVEP